LGIAGVDGTLDDRFTQARYQRRLRAKTGSLRGVTALAGYGVSPDGREFAFACLVNSLKDGVGYIYIADRIMEKVLNLRMGRPLW
jgi:D-alanyl-D-alanine carboxypeptidase/D-alanyl-D-alanine-endopeptidase (penicillin-binding protein 4)